MYPCLSSESLSIQQSFIGVCCITTLLLGTILMPLVSCQVTCDDDYECAGSTITSNDNVLCSGDYSCQNSNIDGTSNDVYCDGSHSCLNSDIQIYDGPASSINCNGNYSCDGAFLKTVDATGSDVNCVGNYSCINSKIVVVDHTGGSVNCIGPYACDNAYIILNKSTSNTLYCYGIDSCNNIAYALVEDARCFSYKSCADITNVSTESVRCNAAYSCSFGYLDESKFGINPYDSWSRILFYTPGSFSLSNTYYYAIDYPSNNIWHVDGSYALVNTTIFGSIRLSLTGFNAGYDSIIICGSGEVCYVHCNNDVACYGLKFFCHTSAVCRVYDSFCDDCNPDYGGFPNITMFTSEDEINVKYNSKKLITTFNNDDYESYCDDSNILVCSEYYECSEGGGIIDESYDYVYCLAQNGCNDMNFTNTNVLECSGHYSCDHVSLTNNDYTINNNTTSILICSGLPSCRSLVAVGVGNIYLISTFFDVDDRMLLASSNGIKNMTLYCLSQTQRGSIRNFECDQVGDVCSLYCFAGCCINANIFCTNGTMCNIFCDEFNGAYCPNGTIISLSSDIAWSSDYDTNPNNFEFQFAPPYYHDPSSHATPTSTTPMTTGTVATIATTLTMTTDTWSTTEENVIIDSCDCDCEDDSATGIINLTLSSIGDNAAALLLLIIIGVMLLIIIALACCVISCWCQRGKLQATLRSFEDQLERTKNAKVGVRVNSPSSDNFKYNFNNNQIQMASVELPMYPSLPGHGTNMQVQKEGNHSEDIVYKVSNQTSNQQWY